MSLSKRTVVSTSIAVSTKLAEIPQTLCIDTDVDTLAVMQRQVPQIQTLSTTVEALFNLETKHVKIPQAQHIDKVALLPVVMQRQAPRPSLNQVTKNVEIPQTQYIDKDTVMSVVMQLQATQILTVAKTMEVPPVPFSGRFVDVPVIKQLMQPQAPQIHTVALTQHTDMSRSASRSSHRPSM